MINNEIDISNIDEGVDRKKLTQIKQRFLTINQRRYDRTCDALSDRQQHFLRLLPLLFHINHPMLPGYISHSIPCGVFGYKPEKEELRLAKVIARSFQYVRDLKVEDSAIDALFIMGSIGTIAHSDTSDLDIWICHSSLLSSSDQKKLQQKCELISQWAAQHINLEIHCFLMRGDKFSEYQGRSFNSEASGSAQHYLLLDEFYRTALWLAGKVPLWWFVPVDQEKTYDDYSQVLLSKRFIKNNDVIDFGGIPEIPPNEFIGAGIWQLYKAIESPYKSILKLLLLEVYASSLQSSADSLQSNAEPLSLAFKRAIYADEPDADALDPYVMVYARIESYLLARGQLQRLDLVRRCFYFKVNKPLSRNSSQANKSWQRILLESVVSKWAWSAHELHMLDNRAYWKAPHVIAERSLLANELSHSYRLLMELNQQMDVHAAISAEELMILGRKLHAAFERKAGKIEWINPAISRDLSEDALCFVREEQPGDDSWHVVRGSQHDLTLRQLDVAPIKRARSLLELLLWCHANGILVHTTKVDIVGKHFLLSNVQKQQLLQTLANWLPVPMPSIEHEKFIGSAQITRMLLFFNIGVEPQHELHKKGLQMLSSQHDALGYSGFKENLVLNADVIQINNWGELVCRHYGNDALVSALLHYLRLFPVGKRMQLPELMIRCFSSGQGSNIANRLTELWRDIIACYYSGTRPRNSRYIFEMGDEYLLLQILQQQPQIVRFKQYEKLLEKLGQAQTDFSPIIIDRHALHDKALRKIADTVRQSGIYLFYRVKGDLATIYVVDEKGSLFTMYLPFHNQQTLLRPLIGFVRAAMRRQQLEGDIGSLTEIAVYELTQDGKHVSMLDTKKIQQDLTPLHFINIKAIADVDVDNNLQFTIYCDEQEFSALTYGAALFTAVARYIYARRQQGERYPCYITDLDLSLCHEVIAQQTGLQLGHYLRIKTELEQKLTAAMQALQPH